MGILSVGFFDGFTTLSIILFIAGFILVVVEMWTPGFGIAGISGITCLIVGVVVSARSFLHGLLLAGAIIVILGALVVVFAILASRGYLPKRLVLSEATDARSGFSGASDFSDLRGACGTAKTMLRPAGVAQFGERRVDVVTQGEFIEEGARLRVIETQGNRVIVAREE